MTFTRRTWLPLVVAALVLAPVTAASASTAASKAPSAAATQAVINLTFDVSTISWVTLFEAADYSSSGQFLPATYSRPTAKPLPADNPLAEYGVKLTPGSRVVVSVFSTKSVNDSTCITGTSTKTKVVVYLSSRTDRPTVKRPHGCAKPGGKAMVTPPSKAILTAQRLKVLDDDLKTVSISEQSYATDNNGAFIADTLSRPTKAALSLADPLVQQGATLQVGDTIVISLFSEAAPNDSYCETGTSSKTHQVLYLSSSNDTPTKHRPAGCVAP